MKGHSAAVGQATVVHIPGLDRWTEARRRGGGGGEGSENSGRRDCRQLITCGPGGHTQHAHKHTRARARKQLLLFRLDHAHVRGVINAAFTSYGNKGVFRGFSFFLKRCLWHFEFE